MAGGGEGGGEPNATFEAARKARALFDLVIMAGDPRRLNPCPGHTPPKRAMHKLHGVGGEIAVKALAVVCRQAEAAGARVDRAVALRTLLQVYTS